MTKILFLTALILIAGLNAKRNNQVPPAEQFTSSEYTVQVKQEVAREILKVEGSAATRVPHTHILLSFSAVSTNMDPQVALSESSQSMNSAIDSIKALGLETEELSTSSFTIEKSYESKYDLITKTHKNEFKGYKVENKLLVKTKKIDLAGKIINAAVKAGIKEVGNVDFSVSSDILHAERRKMIPRAVENAKKKAELALTPLGYVIDKVLLVDINNYSNSISPRLPYFTAQADAATPSLFASKEDISIQVDVEFLVRKA